MSLDIIRAFLTPPYTPSTFDPDFQHSDYSSKRKPKFRSVSPETLNGVRKVINFDYLDSPSKKKIKIAKKTTNKEKEKRKEGFTKLR